MRIASGRISANSAAVMRFLVSGDKGRVRTITVPDCRAAVNSTRPGRMEVLGTPLRSAIWTVMPSALPMLAKRLPVIA